jgi:hypothetical protein
MAMTEAELLAEKAKTEGERVAYVWMKRHIHDYDQSTESAQKLGGYLKERGLELVDANLERAFTELKAQGVRFTRAPAEPEYPPLPASMPDIRSKSDINKIPHEKFRLFMTQHRDKELWKARVHFILQRAAEKS